MDINDLLNTLNSSKEQLNQILNECQTGSPELVLLASKMAPLLADFSAEESELFTSVTSSEEETSSGSIPPSSQ